MSMAMRIGGAGTVEADARSSPPSSPSAACCTPARTTTTAARARAPWLDVDWRAPPAPDPDRRPRGQLRRHRRGPGARCRSTGSARPGSRGSRTSPSSRATTAWWRWTCRASATRRCPSGDISIEYYASWTCPPARRARDRVGRGGGQLDGRLHRRRAGDPRARARRSAWRVVSAAVFWQDYRRAQPLVRLARLSDAIVGAGAGARRPTTSPRGRGCARGRSRAAGFRYPHLISDELAHEMVRSARRTDGFLPALEALADYPLDEELPQDRVPHADRLGRARHARAGQGRQAAWRS